MNVRIVRIQPTFMRICPKCKERESARHQSYCLRCHCEYQKAYHKRHPEIVERSGAKRRAEIREKILAAKDKPCMDCGIKYPWYVMDFDHVRGKKKFNLCMAAQHRWALKTVDEEIAKCDVVCANCHRKRTFGRSSNSAGRQSLTL